MPVGDVQAHAWVRGRVQGVWFRQSTAQEAEALGVSGWVRNVPDGRVEAVFEGPRAGVERMLEYVRVGPVRAHVEDVETVWEEPGGHAGFEVR
jgi:acylphosphatase